MNAIVKRDPFAGFNGMKRLMDRLWDDPFWGFHGYTAQVKRDNPMPIDVTANEKQLVIQASLPGVNPEDVNVTIEDNRLNIDGQVNSVEESEKDRYVIRERHSGSFHRSLALPKDLQDDNVEARFENGVLTLTLPRVPEAKPQAKTIEIKSG